MNSLYERILKLAKFTVEVYKNDISAESLKLINHIIDEFQSYFETGSDDFCYLYDIVQGENGIWNYSIDSKLPEKEQEMWSLEANCLLTCIIRIEMTAHGSDSEDMEIVEENIPDYVSYMENNFKSSRDYSACVSYWGKRMCY